MFNKQKQYFKKKAEGVQNMIWDLQFKRAKTRTIREDIRREYDNSKAKFALLETKIKAQKKVDKICEVHNPEPGKESVPREKGNCVCEYIDNHMDIGEIERLYDQKVLLKRDIDRFASQMKGLDLEIEGCKPNPEYHDGVQGVNDQIEALRELKAMLDEYIKTV